MKNYNKLNFGATINSLGDQGSVGHNDCHNYGSVKGCDNRCPALWNCECDPIHDVLENVTFEEGEIEQLKEIYKI